MKVRICSKIRSNFLQSFPQLKDYFNKEVFILCSFNADDLNLMRLEEKDKV